MKNLGKYISRYWYLYLIAILAMVISITLDMLSPQIIQRIIDDVIVGGQTQLLMKLLLGILGIGVGRAVFQYVKEFLFDIAAINIGCRIRSNLFSHIQTLSLRFFHRNNTGELMARVKDDVDRVWNSAGFVGMLLIESAIHCVFVIYCMFRISPALSVIPLAIMPIVAYMALRMEKKLGHIYEEISQENAELTTVAQENLAGVRTVKAFAREKYEIQRFLSHNKNYYRLNIQQTNTVARYNPNIQFLTKILLILVIVAGGTLVVNGSLSLGQLGAFTEYANNIIWPMEILGWISNDLAAGIASGKKIDKILAEEPEISSPDHPVKDVINQGNLEFRKVSFSIDNSPILDQISFQVEAGKTLGVMGSTGAGKSSLVNLIERFYDVDSGAILLDGINIRDYSLDTLRGAASIVMQDVFLFSDTIAENLRLGSRTKVDLQQMRQAAESASASDFIENLNNEYQTVIGERGVGLSGGQKQRISIARALAKEAPVMIFDDSTSALDMETEYQIQSALSKVKNTTKIIIAHRISAVKDADEIIILDHGRIAERGTHHSLLLEKGLYYQTYLSQYGHDGLEEVNSICQ